MTNETQHDPAEHRIRDQAPALGTLIASLASILLGAGVGYALLSGVVLEIIDLGDVQRIVELARHLDRDEFPDSWTAFVGNSVVRDGIDSQIAIPTQDGEPLAQNLALSGAGLNELQVMLPKLLTRSPKNVVFGVLPGMICKVDPLVLDKAYAYAYSGFVTSWSHAVDEGSFVSLAPGSYAALRSTPNEQRLHFRTALSNWLDHRMRMLMRRDLRSDYTTDWVRPYTRLASIEGPRLDAYIAEVRAPLERCNTSAHSAELAAVERLLAATRRSGTTPIILLVPIHPDLQAAAKPALSAFDTPLAAVAARHGGHVIATHDLLSRDEFADAMHPNAAGREKLSLHVGAWLRERGLD